MQQSFFGLPSIGTRPRVRSNNVESAGLPLVRRDDRIWRDLELSTLAVERLASGRLNASRVSAARDRDERQRRGKPWSHVARYDGFAAGVCGGGWVLCRDAGVGSRPLLAM